MIGREKECGPLVEEYRKWHTPIIGAYLLYYFSKEYRTHYEKAHGKPQNPDFILMVIATTILSKSELCKEIKRKLTIATLKNSLKRQNKHTSINDIHNSIKATLPYTLAALDIALHCGILKLNADKAEYEAIDIKTKRGTRAFIAGSTSESQSYASTLARLFAPFKNSIQVAQALEVSL